jgi:hypothetical protein
MVAYVLMPRRFTAVLFTAWLFSACTAGKECISGLNGFERLTHLLFATVRSATFFNECRTAADL